MTRGLGPLLALVAGAACAAPQQPGVVRTGYIAMATLDGAVVGGAVTLAGSLRTDQEPDLARWVTIPVLPALIVVAGLARLVD